MSEQAQPSWKEQVLKVWPYATASSAVLFVSTAVFGAFMARLSGATESLSYVLAMTDPALAALGMLLVCAIAPSVFLGRPFKMPHVLTLPTIYIALVFMVKSLARSSAGTIQRFEKAQRVDLLWLDLRIVVEAWAFLVAVFLIVSLLKREPKPQEP